MTEYTFNVEKVSMKGGRIWLTISDAVETPMQGKKLEYMGVISLPHVFGFIPKQLIVKD